MKSACRVPLRSSRPSRFKRRTAYEQLEVRRMLTVAVDDQYELTEDSRFFGVSASIGVLQNDVSDGPALKAKLVTMAQHGQLTLRADGAFFYSPTPDYFGQDSFTYVALGVERSAPATVRIEILPVYDAAAGVPDAFRAVPTESLVVDAAGGVLANDHNPDQSILSALLVENVTEGHLTFRADGSFEYAPAGFSGIASFQYQVDDGVTLSAPVQVDLIVNTPPVALDDQFRSLEDEVIVFEAAAGVLANDVDDEQDPLVVEVVREPMFGSVVFTADGQMTYTPYADFFGIDEFRYRVSDGIDESETAQVSIEIQSVNDVPIAVTDQYFVRPGQELVTPARSGVLSNDADIESGVLTAAVVGDPEFGRVDLQADGSFRYVPAEGFAGEDRFQYVASDGESLSSAVEVVIHVTPTPVVISEVMSTNSTWIPTRVRNSAEGRYLGFPQVFDWIELHNQLPFEVSLAGFHLTDRRDDPGRWELPDNVLIPANGHLVVFASGLDLNDAAFDETGRLHTNFGLSQDGEYLALTDATQVVVHEFADGFPALRSEMTYGLKRGVLGYFETPTPGKSNGIALEGIALPPVILQPHGFYDGPIDVAISAAAEEFTVRYTTDGSIPTRSNGIDYQGPITFATTTTLRAKTFATHQVSSPVVTRTFVFVEDVIRQSDTQPPAGWPSRTVRGQVFEYGMDPDVVAHPVWGGQIEDGLKQIPTISIVTDLANLIDDATGIYVNPLQDGRSWERSASIELIYPDGADGFQIDAGLRIRGGFSRANFNPKHSFRLFFRGAYGGSLQFPLFGEEGADTFYSVDLRTAQNYAWSNSTFNDETRNTFLRDIFSRDLQREQGHPYTRGRYYHLYLNGQYWGLYQTEERPEASYAATYFGGDPEDYDVIKASGGTLEATDGSLDSWNDLWAVVNQGFDSLGDYFWIQGKRADGTDDPALDVHIRIDHLIDFAINFMFTGNSDMPTSLGEGRVANNFWAIRQPESRDGWTFVAHDNEHNMLSLQEDQTRDDNAGRVRSSFNPKYIHQQLDQFPEYQMRFADRVHHFMFNDGLLTTSRAQQLMQNRIDQIDLAIVAESARWGDHHPVKEPLGKKEWLAEVDWLMNTFLARRREVVLDQFRQRGLYPEVEAVTFNRHGGEVEHGFSLTMSAPAGTILYTTDGHDPRNVGGSVNAKAKTLTSETIVTLDADTHLKARVWTGESWSALTEAMFEVGVAVEPTALRISEIHFNPGQPTSAEMVVGFENNDDFEFLELMNPTEQTLDLALAQLVRVDDNGVQVGVDFDFGSSDIRRLGPGERVVVVEDLDAFRCRYPETLAVAGQWKGGLGNGGEQLTLRMGNQTLQQFAYSDEWYPATDGGGHSLEINDPASPDLATWGQAASWTPSSFVHGTPGRSAVATIDVNRDGIFNSEDLAAVFAAGEYDDDISGNSTFFEGDWNLDGEFDSEDLVFAFQLGIYTP